ncbi:MAG: hypothetical protein IPM54_08855 [Polyangiaceae bacterium]|nr:hypothetical protein [Polyangiaceae bacterium]
MAFALDAPAIAPTQLDFDASRAPKSCNNDVTFKELLEIRVPANVLKPDAARRLIVRIHRSPRGQKLVDVTLVDATGTTLAEHHQPFGVREECHRVLYEAARTAAKLLGAFKKPPPPEPCPTCPACPSCADCPASSAPAQPLPRRVAPAQPPPRKVAPAQSRPQPPPSTPPRRASVMAGALLATGITSQGTAGPFVGVSVVPSSHFPRFHVEFGGAWLPPMQVTSKTRAGYRMDIVPLFGSICHARHVFRFCGGIASTFYDAQRADGAMGHDGLRVTLAGVARLGAELDVAGAFSMRVDTYMLTRFWRRTFGNEWAAFDDPSPIALGVAGVAVWSLE